MSSSTVFAVMKVTIEVPVRASQGGETLDELYRVSKREAEGVLDHHLDRTKFRIVSPIEFSHAVVRENRP